MIEAAWLLLAIELNGAIVSKGAQAYLDAHRCAVESKVMAPLTASKTSRQATAHALVKGRQPDEQDEHANAWVTDASHCKLDAAGGVMRIRLPQEMLAEKPLALSASSGAMGLALLHDPALLSGNADYSAQPLPQPIPSLAFDVFAGSDLNGLGMVASRGPISAAVLHQKPSQGLGSTRASGELFFENGAQLRLGDFRAERGAEQAFGEYRGVHFASKAQPLKADGKAEAMLALQNPSRVQFLDRNGMAIYSSEMLPPGNYRVQGFAASAVPGFLQAQILDVNGSVQTVTLPWTADRRLLLQGETEWDVFAGHARALAAGLTSPPVLAAKASHGLSSQLTTAAHIEAAGDGHRASLSATSSAIGGMLATLALGRSCTADNCDANWLSELRTSLSQRWHASLAVQQTADILAGAATRSAQLHLTGQLAEGITGSLHLAQSRQLQETMATPGSRQVATIAASMRIAPTASIQLQARHHLLESDASSWSGYLGLTVRFAKERTTVSSQLAFPSNNNGSPRLGLQAAYGGGALYGSHVSLAHLQDVTPRSDVYARHASPYGDVSLRADTVSDRASWSASTRLWLTSHGATLAPAGEDNLVIQRIGMPSVRLAHAGRDAQASDADGVAIFRKAPSWTDAIYAIDAASIPFGAQLSASRIRVPLASNRAYLVDYRHLWSQSRSWRIAGFEALRAKRILRALDRQERKVFLSEDGYADLQSVDQLPLSIATEGQGRWRCELKPDQTSATLLMQEMLLQCAPHIAL